MPIRQIVTWARRKRLDSQCQSRELRRHDVPNLLSCREPRRGHGGAGVAPEVYFGAWSSRRRLPFRHPPVHSTAPAGPIRESGLRRPSSGMIPASASAEPAFLHTVATNTAAGRRSCMMMSLLQEARPRPLWTMVDGQDVTQARHSNHTSTLRPLYPLTAPLGGQLPPTW